MENKNLVNAVDFKMMSTAASYQFMYDNLRRIMPNEKAYKAVETEMGVLSTALGVFDQELKRSAKDMLTDKIKDADELRDKAYRAWAAIVRAMAICPPTEEMAEAANLLVQHLKDYGIDVNMDRMEETALLMNMLSDLKTLGSKYKEARDKLGLEVWYNSLYNKNLACHELMLQRTNEQARQQARQLQQARRDAEAAYRDVIQMLNAHILVEGDADYKDVVEQLNAEVLHYNQTIIARRKAAAKKSDGGKDDKKDDGGKDEPEPDDDKKKDDGGDETKE